jgi:uncharacterized repeat protein (TIGR01451 family)
VNTSRSPQRRPHPGRRLAPVRRALVATVSALLAVVGLGLSTPAPASAAPVYDIRGQWEPNTPSTVGRGDVVTAIWRVNVNDDQPAPANDPVDDVTFTVTATNGLFTSVPDLCLTSGVTPASSISADGRTLTCNLGTVVEGTAVVVQAPMVVDGNTGDQISAAADINGQAASVPPLDIQNSFQMDMQFGGNTTYEHWNPSFTGVDVDLEWALRLHKGSDPGPDSVTYRLTMADSNGGAVSVGTGINGDVGCGPFNSSRASGVPWSELPGYPADQQTSFVDSCTLTPVSGQPGKFDLTLTGINYDLSALPTKDSMDPGQPLPTDWSYIASGSLWFHIATDQAGSLSLAATAPTYTSTTGLTSPPDLVGNNTTNKSYTLPGTWSAAWWRPYTNSGGTAWDDTYRVSAGTTVFQYANDLGIYDNVGPNGQQGDCLAFDTAYVTYTPPPVDAQFPQIRGLNRNGGPSGGPLTNPPPLEYYVGNQFGDPEAFDCGSDPGGWTTTLPANLSTVKAIRVRFPHSMFAAEGIEGIQLNAYTTIKPNVPVGQDVWMFGSVLRDGVNWIGPGNNNVITPTPGARYPSTNGRRDILRIVQATPAIEKSSDRSVVKPGDPATFTLTYSANGAGAIPPTVDNYQIVDTLPLGMTYVAGSASPAPTVTADAQGRQVLTWNLDGVPTNVENALTYQAVAGASVTPGQTLTNTATSSLGGQTTAPAEAQVTVSSSGYTQVSKTTDTPFVPNLDGQGNGAGSWTVRVKSFDPLPQAFTDTIDVLPYNGDGRGTDYTGSYSLTGVDVPDGQTVYYTTAYPSTLSDDPDAPSNGSAGDVTGNTVGWTTTMPASPTAIRVIGPALDPGAEQSFKVDIMTSGAHGGDLYVNRAQGVAGHTQLVMRTSAPMSVANYYSASLKKYVQDDKGRWHDANDVADYPVFHYGDTIHYRIVVTNTGQGTLTNIDVSDDKQPQLGHFHIDSLDPGKSASHEYSITLRKSVTGTVVNTASATADTPTDSQVPPTINTDPAGFEVANYTTVKTADPKPGSLVYPGQKVTYTVTMTQQGTAPADASFSDDLSRVLDDARYDHDVTASIGTAHVHAGHLVWSGTIPVGGTAVVRYSVTVRSLAAIKAHGNFHLRNVVTSDGCKSASRCTTKHKVGRFDLTVAKSVVGSSRVQVGRNFWYRLVVTNRGPDNAPAPIDLTDPLPKGLELVSASGHGWTCATDKAADVVSCTRDRALQVDHRAAPVFVVAKPTKSAVGHRLVNTAVVHDNGDRVRSNNHDSAAVRVTKVPSLPDTGYRLAPPGKPWLI